MPVRNALLAFLSLTSLAACAHEPAPVEQSAPAPHYVLQSAGAAYAIATPGRVSRYQRQTIVAGGTVEPKSQAGKDFDAILDHLESLMADEIVKNNRYAMVGDVGMSAVR